MRAQRWRRKDRTLLPVHYVDAVVDVLVGVIDDRDFDGQSSNAFPASQSAREIHLETRALAEAKIGVERGYALHSLDRKSTRLNSSHITISYAVFCLKKK